MRVQNISTKQVFHGTMYENLGDGHISIYNHHEEIARVPTELARLIFSENEIPYMEEVEGKVIYTNGRNKLSFENKLASDD